MKKPDFFIVGAPKAGTTALASYLAEHPEIFFAEPKEPHYFAEDLENYRYAKTLKSYERLFSKAPEDAKAIGEGSVMYLYSKVAIARLLSYQPEARLIVMLRNPVDLVYSFHSQALFSGDEEVVDFKTAWYLSEKRGSGEALPKTCRHPKLLNYKEIGLLGSQLKHLLECAPAVPLKIILFEDFISDTKKIYDDTLNFLALKNDERCHFPKVNPNTRYRNRSLRLFTAHPPAFLAKAVKTISMFFGRSNLGFSKFLTDINTVSVKREPLDEEFAKELSDYFKDDILLLSSLIDRNLEHWLNQ